MESSPAPTGATAHNPDLLWRVVGEEALLLDTSTGNYFSLDPIGSTVWERLQRGESLDQIASAIAASYQVDAGVVRKDIDDLLAELRDARLWT